MSSHADTIRLVFDWPMAYHSVGELADAKQALDALLAELEEWRLLAARQLEQFTVTTQKYRAENQRWLTWSGGRYPDDSPGDVITAYADGAILLDDGIVTWNPLRALEWIHDHTEALAGDAE